MNEVIATEQITGVRPTGERLDIRICLGRPYKKYDDPETWACPVEVEPLYSQLADVVGNSSLHSLSLAYRLAFFLLRGFREDGGKLLYDDGTEFPVEAYSLELGRSAT